jgi:hypothetical protein
VSLSYLPINIDWALQLTAVHLPVEPRGRVRSARESQTAGSIPRVFVGLSHEDGSFQGGDGE